MSVLLYNIFLFLYRAAIYIASIWNPKAKIWIHGRHRLLDKIADALKNDTRRTIWIHCSSLGEFEQGRPLIEKLKAESVTEKIVVTFFSPSGYEIRKNYPAADHIFYLPFDSPSNAHRFIDLLNPVVVIFIKYDYWYHYLRECHHRNIPLLMVSAIFRESQPFFKWYGALHRKMLKFFDHFFVQDDNSLKLLHGISIKNVTVAGDTRFDRVADVADTFEPIGVMEAFCRNDDVIIAGSTWPADEKLLSVIINESSVKLVIAPHEVNQDTLNRLSNTITGAGLFSSVKNNRDELMTLRCLIIDNIGMLSRLYKYSTICYIGGGFSQGIHNILESAVYYKPIVFGPNHDKFREARELIEKGGAFSINNKDELLSVVNRLRDDKQFYNDSAKAAGDYVRNNRGATKLICDYIRMNRLLTKP